MTEEPEQRPSFFASLGPLGRLWLLFALWFSCTIVLATMAKIPGFDFLMGGANTSPQKLRLAQIFYSVSVFAIPALVFANAFSSKGPAWLGVYRSTRIRVYLAAMITMACAIAVIYWLGEVNTKLVHSEEDKQLEAETQRLMAMPGITDLLFNLFALALIPALCEELFFRGCVQGVLREWTKNMHVAIWIGAAIFSFMHFHFAAFIPRLLMGALLGYFFAWSRTLWLAIAAHFIFNASQFLLNYLEQHHYADFGVYVAPYMAIGSTVLTSAGIYLVYRLLRDNRSEPENFHQAEVMS